MENNINSKGKLYVLCSDKFKDNPVYACVQGGHAVAKYVLEETRDWFDCEQDYDYWKNYTIVYVWYPHKDLQCGIHDRAYALNCISCKWVPYYVWHEPDQNNEVTAACFWETDMMDIEKHDPYWYHTKEQELGWCRKVIDKLELVK